MPILAPERSSGLFPVRQQSRTVEFHEDLFNYAYLDHLYTETRYNFLYGGANGGKSEFVAGRLFMLMHERDGYAYAVIRKVANTLRNSVYQLFKNIAIRWGIYDRFTWYDGRLEIRYKQNRIIFLGVEDPEKLKSLAEVQEIWIEEPTELSEEEFNQVDLRLRGESEYLKRIWMTLNPVSAEHWIIKRFLPKGREKLYWFESEEENLTVSRTTYLHNRFASEQDIKVLLKMAEIDPLYYDVYALGMPGIIAPKNPFFKKFEYKKHVRQRLRVINEDPFYLSFDFNSDKETCLISQKDISIGKNHYIKEIHEPTLDLYGVCNMIKETFPSDFYFVTGDPSGRGRSAYTAGNASGYTIIEQEIPWANFDHVLTSTLGYTNSRFITNALLTYEKDMLISQEGCPTLISDIKRTKTSSDGGLDKNDCNKFDYGHVADAFRYDLYAFMYDTFRSYGLPVK